MKRKSNNVDTDSIKIDIVYSIACLIGATMLILVFLLNERNFNQTVSAVFGLVLVINSIVLIVVRSKKTYIRQISTGIMILSTCSGFYFSLIPLVCNPNNKGAILVYFASVGTSILIRFINKNNTIQSIRNKSLLLLKVDVATTTMFFILYFVYIVFQEGHYVTGKIDIKTIIILGGLLNICTFCVSALITNYFKHKYDIKLINKMSAK